MSDITAKTGTCLCGKVSLDIDRFDRQQVVGCHCTQCRKQTGHFVAATRVENSRLTINGQEHLKWYKASPEAERGFCQHCGSFMLWRAFGSKHTAVMAGCVDGNTGLKIDRHIFVDDKGDYYDLEPGIPQYGQDY